MSMHHQTDFSLVPMLSSFPATTARLKLVPQDKGLADAETREHFTLAAALGAKVPENWPPKFVSAMEDRKGLPWKLYYMVFTTDSENPVLVGIAGVAPWSAEARTLQFGAALIPEHQGRHLGPELGAAIAEWALGVPDFDRVICEVPADHVGVAKALERAGYTREDIAPGPGFATFVRHVRTQG